MCSFGTYCILLWIISSFFSRLTYDTLTFETTQSSTSKTTKLTREFWSHYFVKEYCTRSSCHDVTIVTTKLMWASLKFGKKFIGSLEKMCFILCESFLDIQKAINYIGNLSICEIINTAIPSTSCQPASCIAVRCITEHKIQNFHVFISN